jgi:uncharacterized protein YcnI
MTSHAIILLKVALGIAEKHLNVAKRESRMDAEIYYQVRVDSYKQAIAQLETEFRR